MERIVTAATKQEIRIVLVAKEVSTTRRNQKVIRQEVASLSLVAHLTVSLSDFPQLGNALDVD